MGHSIDLSQTRKYLPQYVETDADELERLLLEGISHSRKFEYTYPITAERTLKDWQAIVMLYIIIPSSFPHSDVSPNNVAEYVRLVRWHMSTVE